MKRCAALFCTFFFAVGLCSLLPVHGEAEIYDEVIRLHVLANSDSDADQTRKLAVRDAVLADAQALLSDADTREEAVTILTAGLPRLEETARQALAATGSSATVQAQLTEESYPTRTYTGVSGTEVYPAGTYLSLQIKLGEARGQNWWCVLYPTLCLSQATGPAATDRVTLAGTDSRPRLLGLSDRQYTVITGTDANLCEVRLKLLETLESLLE